MTAGLIIIAIIGLLAVLSHRRTRFEQKVFRHVPVNEWLTLIVFPLLMFIGWALVVKNIILRPSINLISIDDFDFTIVMMIFMMYAFVGNSLHFTSKIIWRYLPEKDNHKMVYRVNEMFHGRLSHYLVYVTISIVLLLMAIIELNHPVIARISDWLGLFLLIVGVVFGFSSAKAIFYTNQWFGGYNKPLSIFASIALIILVAIFKTFQISFYYYPVSFFILVINVSFLGSFFMRQFLIFTRLNNKHKLRFLQKIFSA